MSDTLRLAAMAATGILLAAGPAWAQQTGGEDGRPIQPQERVAEGYEQLGIRQGAFLILPSVELDARYDDNIFATNTDTKSDVIALLRPEVRVRSDWSSHALNLRAQSEVARYKSHSREDYEHYTLAGDGRVDISRRSNVTGRLSYRDATEDRSSPDDVNGLKPTPIRTFVAGAGFAQRFNRVSFDLSAERTQLDFDNVATSTGAIINNNDRDRTEHKFGARVAYEIQPSYSAFVRGEYNERDYRLPLDDAGVNRDSDGYGVTAGMAFDLTGVTQGDVGLAYAKQRFDDPALSDADGIGVNGGVTWNATRLTTVRGTAALEIGETTSTGASGIVTQRVGVTVNHELRRNVLLNGSLNYANSDYEGISRKDDTYGAGLGARYLLNRYFSVGANWNHTRRDSNVNVNDFTRNRFVLRLRAQL